MANNQNLPHVPNRNKKLPGIIKPRVGGSAPRVKVVRDGSAPPAAPIAPKPAKPPGGN